jgi:hypothetical protein
VTISERIAKVEAANHLPDNVIRMDEARDRRTTPRWIEWTRDNQTNPNAAKSYDNGWGGEAA